MFGRTNSKGHGVLSFMVAAAIGVAGSILLKKYRGTITSVIKEKYDQVRGRVSDIATEVKKQMNNTGELQEDMS